MAIVAYITIKKLKEKQKKSENPRAHDESSTRVSYSKNIEFKLIILVKKLLLKRYYYIHTVFANIHVKLFINNN